MNAEARDYCLAVGSDQLLEPDGIMQIMHVLRDYFAKETIDEYIVRFDLLRRKAEVRMQIGGSLQETYVSIM